MDIKINMASLEKGDKFEIYKLNLWDLRNKQQNASFTYCILLQSKIDDLKREFKND